MLPTDMSKVSELYSDFDIYIKFFLSPTTEAVATLVQKRWKDVAESAAVN